MVCPVSNARTRRRRSSFKNGVIKEQIVGNTTKDTISKMIDNHL